MVGIRGIDLSSYFVGTTLVVGSPAHHAEAIPTGAAPVGAKGKGSQHGVQDRLLMRRPGIAPPAVGAHRHSGDCRIFFFRILRSIGAIRSGRVLIFGIFIRIFPHALYQ